jgi:hypothetical protein
VQQNGLTYVQLQKKEMGRRSKKKLKLWEEGGRL